MLAHHLDQVFRHGLKAFLIIRAHNASTNGAERQLHPCVIHNKADWTLQLIEEEVIDLLITSLERDLSLERH